MTRRAETAIMYFMSTEYADRITKEILAKVNGQNKLAEQAMLTLIKRDPQFLQSLVEPYLNGIILHAIERVKKPASRTSAPVAARSAAMPKVERKPAPAPRDIPAKGLDGMMKVWAKSFDKDAPAPSADGKKVSANHIKALQAMIKKNH